MAVITDESLNKLVRVILKLIVPRTHLLRAHFTSLGGLEQRREYPSLKCAWFTELEVM